MEKEHIGVPTTVTAEVPADSKYPFRYMNE